MAYNRILSRLDFIENQAIYLKEWIPASKEKFLADTKTQAAIERYIQTSIEAILEICIQFVKYFNLGTPSSPDSVLKLLTSKFKTMPLIKSLKGFRNVLVHQYNDLKNELVYEFAMTFLPDLEKILEEFHGTLKSPPKL